MKNFIFKSTDADLQKIVSIIASELNLLQKNVLYITYRVDSILKNTKQLVTDKGLQRQVDEYFEDDAEEKAEQIPETSPQTDSDEQ